MAVHCSLSTSDEAEQQTSHQPLFGRMAEIATTRCSLSDSATCGARATGLVGIWGERDWRWDDH